MLLAAHAAAVCRRRDEPDSIAALTALVAFEKLTAFGMYTARVSGLLLIGSGAWMLAGM